MNWWMIMSIEGEPYWPSTEMEVTFSDRNFILRPGEDTSAPDVRTLFSHPEEELTAYEAISAFLSNLAWWQRRPIRIARWMTCTAPMRLGNTRPGPTLWPEFALSDRMTAPTDKRAARAIAIYRESSSLENTPYEFLGYMKIVEILHRKWRDQINWINRTLTLLTEKNATARIAALRPDHPDLGEYLYVSGRCAVAHAYHDPVVNPDNPENLFRLARDLPVARALAEYVIEHELHAPWGNRRFD